MDLPTYTNIWRIEKRLYKLYDLRLPMPLPIVWIGVFLGVLVPWSILLAVLGMPFETPWHVVYLVPPGIVTWLSTRPVIESKRLTELLQSQIRYIGEPKTWARLAPLHEPDEITFTARVWRAAPQAAQVLSADTVKSTSRSRRGTRAKPKHTAPRRRPLEALAPRQLPSVKSRPAASLAGATASEERLREAPALGTAGTVVERPRITWGDVVTEPAQALAPAAPVPTGVPPKPRSGESPEPAGEHPASPPQRVPERVENVRERALETAVAATPERAENVRERALETAVAATPERAVELQGLATEAHGFATGAVEAHGLATGAVEAQGFAAEAVEVQGFGAEAVVPVAHPPVRTRLTLPPEVSNAFTRPAEPPAAEAEGEVPSGDGADAEATAPPPIGPPREAEVPSPVNTPREAEVPSPIGTQRQATIRPSAGAQSQEPAAVPPSAGAQSQEPAAASVPPPIGTEALRRLRRLAASAEGRAGGAAPASETRGPAGAGRQRSEGLEREEQAVPQERRTFSLESIGLSDRRESLPGGSGAAEETDGREQHRKGQPPRPTARPTPFKGGLAVEPPSPAVLAENAERPVESPVTRVERPAESPVTRVERADGSVRPGTRPERPAESPAKRVERVESPVTPVESPVARPERPVESPVARPERPVESPAKRAEVPAARAEERPRVPSRSAGREQAAPPLSIRAVPAGSGASADPAVPSVPVPGPRAGDEPKVRRVESVVGRDQTGGWRRLAQVVVGGGGPSRNDGIETDEARARTVLTGSRRVVVLGCTGGAGQTTTALMLGHTLARYRDDRVLAVDANTGDHTLTSRIHAESPETLTSLLSGLDGVGGYLSMRAYTTRCESGLEVVGSDSDAAAARRLADRGLLSDQRLGQAMRMLDRHYRLILVDPAASVAARMLPYADQLILVAPASEDAPEAVAMTFDWLDGHGSTELRRRAIMVINGVSRRSMAGVEQAEAVARGRCRAIVRVPWEDELAPGHAGPVQLTHLRAGGRRAYVALAGVVASGLASTSHPSEEVAR
ncbi:conjugal transfer protein [Sphaerisporangium fuscum]|uniref:conjugal transfer protein n=1 Tax=Sphaerisporangium fuscum TaxID=2835868 RepID=UPI001BDC72A4|nr:conjugal transfer protein [Sphaerisporangium fuscum]